MDNEEKSVLAHPEKCTDVWACVDVCPTGACRKSAKKEAVKKEPAKKPVGKPAKK
jgi:NAD-dependent dihydropyrimidine dehydrogenase PreA subunit